MASKARLRLGDPVRLAEQHPGIDQRRDHQAVPVGQNLVVEARPDPLFARCCSIGRSTASRASSSLLRGKSLRRLRIL